MVEHAPHRVLARVEPIAGDVRVALLRMAGATPFDASLLEWNYGGHWRCPVCASKEGRRSRLCAGRWRWWWPFAGAFACRIGTPHFHMRCTSCDNRWVMAPADVTL